MDSAGERDAQNITEKGEKVKKHHDRHTVSGIKGRHGCAGVRGSGRQVLRAPIGQGRAYFRVYCVSHRKKKVGRTVKKIHKTGR